MGNLDWGSKFSLDMSQNMGEGKKVHPVVGFERDEDNVAFYWDNKGPGSIDSKKFVKIFCYTIFFRNNICDKHNSDNYLVRKKNSGTKLVTILFIL